MMKLSDLLLIVSCLIVTASSSLAAEPATWKYRDKQPQKYHLTARASQLDSKAKEYPEIDFVFESNGKVQDLQNAVVDTRVKPRGELVIWLMGYNSQLFDRLSGYGFHAIQPHYANRWFSKVCTEKPVGETCRGNVRLEAATGQDFSDKVDIAESDGMKTRALKFVKWLHKENPQARWNLFITRDGKDLDWERVILAGSSHGSTTAARFAKHQKVGRVVMFCGPRDQYQNWQRLPSATPTNRYFGFSHTQDGGWTADHYCRSWELIGLNEYGPIVNVDEVASPFQNSRRLITSFDVDNNANRAHSSVVPGNSSYKNKEGGYMHEAVWEYLFTHPVDLTGDPVPLDASCDKDQQQ